MKKGGWIVLLISLFVLPGAAMAMPSDGDTNTAQLGNAFPEVWRMEPFGIAWGLGAGGDWVLDRNLDGEGVNQGRSGADLESTWYGGNVYLDPPLPDMLPKVHLNLFVGVADFKIGDVGINNDLTTKVKLETDTDLAAGVGGKVDIWDYPVFSGHPNMQLFGVGGGRYYKADVESADRGPTAARTLALEVEYYEWQGGFGIAQRIDDVAIPLGIPWTPWMTSIPIPGISVMPYAGALYSDVSLNISGTSSFLPAETNQQVLTGKRDSDENATAFAGIQIIGWDNRLSVGVEGRFVAETAVSVNGRIRW